MTSPPFEEGLVECYRAEVVDNSPEPDHVPAESETVQ